MKFHKNPSSGAELFHADEGMDIHDEAISATFHNSMNAPKNTKLCPIIITLGQLCSGPLI
jgi:hypothetical protein